MTLTPEYIYCHIDSKERVPLCSLELDPRVIDLFVRHGIIESEGETIHVVEVLRINKVLRLKKFFGVNLAGAAIIVDLLERLEKMQEEIERLQEGR